MSGAAASGPSGSSVTLRATFGAVQAADDGVAAMASQDSDASELELAKEYSEVLAQTDDDDDRILNALCAKVVMKSIPEGQPRISGDFFTAVPVKKEKTRRRRRRPEAGKEWGREKEGKEGERKLI